MLPKTPPMLNSEQWNAIIAALPGAHILQTWEWGKVKSLFGWQAHFLVWFQKQGGVELVTDRHLDHLKKRPVAAAALALQRNISVGGFSHRMGVMYLPKGPLLDWNDTSLVKQVLNDVSVFGEKHGAIFIKIDPDIEVGSGIPGSEEANESSLGAQITQKLKSDGWQFSGEQVQFRNTVVIDLTPSQDELLANMKQKTRYNINLAMRKGVSVRLGNQADLGMLFRMYAETSVRDGFVIRNESYYKEVWSTFLHEQRPTTFDSPQAEVLIAEVEGAPIAGIFIFRFAGRAWYLYGMSSQMHRDKMPNYLLQWEAIKRLKAANCLAYDLWGAPDQFVESDPLWGVYRFKEGLGGTVHRYLGAWDLPLNRVLYRLYTRTLPGLLDIMRTHGRAATKQALG